MQSEELSDINSPDTEALWRLVHPYTGAVDEVRATARGNSSDVTALVACESGPVFVKACRNRPGGRRASLIRERQVNPYVRAISPALRWQAEDDEWIALGFEVVEGRSADFTPGSPDLQAVVDVLNRIGELPLPAEAHDWPETRWNRYAADADAPLFEGRTLLFTDINPDNVMIGDDRTWAVDWSWPTRGAAFIDPACLVIQLIAAGHSAGDAEFWAAHCKAWTEADCQAIDAFCAASVRMHRTFAERSPEASWIQKMAEATESWSCHRRVTG